MADATTVSGLPFPEGTDANNVPSDMSALAEALDKGWIRHLTSTEIAALGAGEKPAGVLVFNTTTSKLQVSNGSAFVDVTADSLPLTGGTVTGSLTVSQGTLGVSHSGSPVFAMSQVVSGAGRIRFAWRVLSGGPTLELKAATDAGDYVGGITAVEVDRATGGVTVPQSLTLGGDPSEALHAASKQYVDAVGVWQDWTVSGIGMESASPLSFDWTAASGQCRYTRIGDTMHGYARGTVSAAQLPISSHDSKFLLFQLPATGSASGANGRVSGSIEFNAGGKIAMAKLNQRTDTRYECFAFREGQTIATGDMWNYDLLDVAWLRSIVTTHGTATITYGFTYEAA